MNTIKSKIRRGVHLAKWQLYRRFKQNHCTAIFNVLDKIVADTFYNNDMFNLNAFVQCIQAVNFATNMDRLNVVLELGRGYSTVLLPLLKKNGTRIFSIDAIPIKRYSIRKQLEAVCEQVEFIDGFSVTKKEMSLFYDGTSHKKFLELDSKVLKDTAQHFIREYPSDIYYRDMQLDSIKGNFAVGVLDKLFCDNDWLKCFSKLFPTRFESDFRFAGSENRSCLDRLIEQVDYFDFVFFDSGELSSMIEWMKLKDRISVGGLAVFHDIYFPKSIKNFLVCAFIYQSPEWEILYQDRSTPQGLLIARRVKSS